METRFRVPFGLRDSELLEARHGKVPSKMLILRARIVELAEASLKAVTRAGDTGISTENERESYL